MPNRIDELRVKEYKQKKKPSSPLREMAHQVIMDANHYRRLQKEMVI